VTPDDWRLYAVVDRRFVSVDSCCPADSGVYVHVGPPIGMGQGAACRPLHQEARLFGDSASDDISDETLGHLAAKSKISQCPLVDRSGALVATPRPRA
jgi:hypothetical protein